MIKMNKTSVKSTTEHLILYGLLILWLAPLLWMFVTAVKPRTEIFTLPPQWVPSSVTLEHLKNVLQNWPFMKWVLNSFIIAIAASVLVTIVSIFAAYSFARLDWKGRDTLFIIFLASMLIPWQINAVPLYFTISKFNLLNTHIAVFLPI